MAGLPAGRQEAKFFLPRIALIFTDYHLVCSPCLPAGVFV